MTIKQSVCIPILKPAGMPLEAFIEKVAEIGYAAVEIWSRDQDFETLVSLARKHHLTLASMIGHDMTKGGLNDPARHDQIETELRASIDTAADYGIPGLICFSGNRRAGLSDPQGMANTAASLHKVAPYAEKKGSQPEPRASELES